LDPLKQLAIIWCGVFVAGVLANKTRLTSVLYFLAFGALMVNIGVLPEKSSPDHVCTRV
jgi:Kef-type K+ transport system membrane component KefB